MRVEHQQGVYDVRCEWGRHGVEMLARECAVVVIVDVLSFCTSVDVAVGRGARVLPQRWHNPYAAREAATHGALRAGPRDGDGPSLRPSSLLDLAAGTVLALPSPNGASLCAAAACHDVLVLAGCLRNATAVATAARSAGGPIGVVPAGERWPDDTLRVAAEDALGAGAIIAALGDRSLSPEAELVAAQFAAAAARAARSTGRARLGPGADRRRLRRRRRPGRGPRRQPGRTAARRRRPDLSTVAKRGAAAGGGHTAVTSGA